MVPRQTHRQSIYTQKKLKRIFILISTNIIDINTKVMDAVETSSRFVDHYERADNLTMKVARY